MKRQRNPRPDQLTAAKHRYFPHPSALIPHPSALIPHPSSLLNPHPLQCRCVIRPATAHPHPRLQKDLAAEQPFHVLARLSADLFELFSILAYNYGLLIGPVDEYSHMDSAQAFRGLEALDFHRRRVRQLIAEQPEKLFPHELGCEKSLGKRRDFIFVVDAFARW